MDAKSNFAATTALVDILNGLHKEIEDLQFVLRGSGIEIEYLPEGIRWRSPKAVRSGAPEGNWDWVKTLDDGFRVKIRETDDEREVVLEPFLVHESLGEVRAQGLYIRDHPDALLWDRLAGLLQFGRRF